MSPPADDLADETPTPALSASYSVYRAECDRLADDLERAGQLFARRLDHLDPRAAARCRGIALELRSLANRFGAWPLLPADVVAAERQQMVQRFFDRADETIRLLEALPTHPALGTPRRHR